MKYMSVTAIAMVLALSAFGHQTICLDTYENRLSYEFNGPDGGAPIPPHEKLVLDKRVLIESNQNVEKATIEFKGKKRQFSTRTENDQNVMEAYFAKAVVTLEGGKEPLFDNIVFCRSTRYVGPPMP